MRQLGILVLYLTVLFPVAQTAGTVSPEAVATFPESYNTLFRVGSQLRLFHLSSDRFTDPAYSRVVDEDNPTSGGLVEFPSDAFAVTLGPDDTPYALVWGAWREGISSDVALWRMSVDGRWQPVATVFEGQLDREAIGGSLARIGQKVAIALQLKWLPSETPDGIGHLFDPTLPLILFAPTTGLLENGIAGAISVESASGGLIVHLGDSLPSEEAFTTDGHSSIVSIPVGFPSALNRWDPFSSQSPPSLQTAPGPIRFRQDQSYMIDLLAPGGAPMNYMIPLHEGGYFEEITSENPVVFSFSPSPRLQAYHIAENGSAYAGFFQRNESATATNPARFFAAFSFDYLNTFSFAEFDDDGLLASYLADDALYFIRTKGPSSVLYRVTIPPPPSVGSARHLTLKTHVNRVSAFPFSPAQSDARVVVPVPDSDSPDYIQLETSIDLIHWYPLGLPVSREHPPEIYTEDFPQRFFR